MSRTPFYVKPGALLVVLFSLVAALGTLSLTSGGCLLVGLGVLIWGVRYAIRNQRKKAAKTAKPTDVLSHWPKLIQNLQFSPHEFYSRVERTLASHQIPGLEFSRIYRMEGGPLSARREYLRLIRERLVFEICGAPFGTGFFVSVRCVRRPWNLGLVVWCLLGLAILVSCASLIEPRHGVFGWLSLRIGRGQTMASIILITVIVMALVAIVLRVVADFDGFLRRIPVAGVIQERFFRKMTYYRIDRICMTEQAVQAAVMQVINEISRPEGIRPFSEFDRQPPLGDLLHREVPR